MKEERRDFSSSFQIERRDAGKTTVLRGHAAVFNKETLIGGEFVEVIAPGFFRNAIRNSDPRALFNHNVVYVLGRRSANTLTLQEDHLGLLVEIIPPDSQTIRDLVITPVERGDLKEFSFAFVCKTDKWEKLPGGRQKRTLIECEELMDISIVTYPAYEAADDLVLAQRRREWHASVPPAPHDLDADAQAEGEARARAFQLGSSHYAVDPQPSGRKWSGDCQGEGEARARMFDLAGVSDSQGPSGYAGLPSFVRYSDELARQAQAEAAARARSLGLAR